MISGLARSSELRHRRCAVSLSRQRSKRHCGKTRLRQAGGSSAADPVLLYRNENPYGPSEKVLAVLRESVAGGNRYPRTEYETLKEKLAALHRVKREQIVLGCGSAEILCMSAHAFLGPGKKLVQAAPTFPALGKLAAGAGEC